MPYTMEYYQRDVARRYLSQWNPHHFSGRIAHALYPTGMPEVQDGEVLLHLNIELLRSGGVIQFD